MLRVGMPAADQMPQQMMLPPQEMRPSEMVVDVLGVRVLAAMLDYCGLSADVDQIYSVFATDSQAGTVFSRASREEREVFPFEAEDYAQMQSVLSSRPRIQSPEFIAPNTRHFN